MSRPSEEATCTPLVPEGGISGSSLSEDFTSEDSDDSSSEDDSDEEK